LFGSWPKFQGDAFGGTVAKAATDVSTTDHKTLTVLGLPADQDMDMRIVSVPVVGRDPVKLCAEVVLHISHSSRVNVRRFSNRAASSGEMMNRK
jgi:hypothetical protein